MIIGINGYKGVGKDTVGDIFCERFGFTKIAFAHKLKVSVAALLDISYEDVDRYKELDAEVSFMGKSMKFRTFLQRYGTEAHRDIFDENFWVDALLLPLNHYHERYVVTDARFENELRAIRSLGGFTVRVERPGVTSDGHASEQVPPQSLIDYVIINDGAIDELHAKVEHALDYLIGV